MLPSSHRGSPQTRTSHAGGLILEVPTTDETRSVLLFEGEWAIGSDPSNRIVVANPTVQDRHCCIVCDGDETVVQAWAEDTFVNGVRVEESSLTAGDTLTLGSASLLVRHARPDELMAQLPTVVPASQKASARSLRNKMLLTRISSAATLLDLLESEFQEVDLPLTDPLDRTIDRIERGLSSAQATAKAKAARCEESFFSIRSEMGELTELLQAQFEGIDQNWQTRVQVDVDAIVAQAWAADTMLRGGSLEDVPNLSGRGSLAGSGPALGTRSVRPEELMSQVPCLTSSPLTSTVRACGFEALLTCIGSIANTLDRLESDFPTEAPLDRAIDRIQRGLPSADAIAQTKASRCAEAFLAIRHELDELTEVLQGEFEDDDQSSLPSAALPNLDETGFERERGKLDAMLADPSSTDSPFDLGASAVDRATSPQHGFGHASPTGTASPDLKLGFDRLFELSESLSNRAGSEAEPVTVEPVTAQSSVPLDEADLVDLIGGDLSHDFDESQHAEAPATASAEDSQGEVAAARLTSDKANASKLSQERQKLERFAQMIDDLSEERDAEEACRDEDAVAVGSGAILIHFNATENVLRSRNEAVRQMDELLLSYAKVDPDVSDAFSKSLSASDRKPKSSHEATFDFDSGESLCPDYQAPEDSNEGSDERAAERVAVNELTDDDGVSAGGHSFDNDASSVAAGNVLESESEGLDSDVDDSERSLLDLQEIESLIAEHVATDVLDAPATDSEEALSGDSLEAELVELAEGPSDVEQASGFEGWSNDSATRIRLLEAVIAQEVATDIEASATSDAETDREETPSSESADWDAADAIRNESDDSDLLADPEAEAEAEFDSAPLLMGSPEVDAAKQADDEQALLLRSQLADMFGISRSLEQLSKTAGEVDEVVEDEVAASDVSVIDDVMSEDLFEPDDSVRHYLGSDESLDDEDLDNQFSLFAESEPELSEPDVSEPEAIESVNETDASSAIPDELPTTHVTATDDADDASEADAEEVTGEAEITGEMADFEESEADDLPRLFSKPSSTPAGDGSPSSEERKTLNLRSQLADLFGMSASTGASSEAEPQIPEAESASKPDQSTTASTAPAAPSAEPADPIRAYMEQLLARNRKQLAAPENVRPKPSGPMTVSQQQAQEPANVESSTPRATGTEWLAQGPAHKQDKEAVRANMQQLRALANQQARAAVVRAGKKQMRLQLLTKTAAALMSMAFGATAMLLNVPHIYGYACFGLGAVFTVDLIITVFRNSLTRSKQERLVQDGQNEEAHLKSNARTEDRLDHFTRSTHNDSHKP